MAGNRDGVIRGIGIGQATNAIGHVVGFATTGAGPEFRAGAFFYEGKLYGDNPQGGNGLTLGNVISGPQGLIDQPQSMLYKHEMNHVVNPIERALGALYVPAHILDLAVGHSVRALGGGCSGFVIEQHAQQYPYSVVNPGFCR